MADDLLVTDETISNPLVLKRLLSDIIERLDNKVDGIISSNQIAQVLEIVSDNNSIELLGDIIGGPLNFDKDGDIRLPTIINLPNVTHVDGGDSASIYPEVLTGPFGAIVLSGSGNGGGLWEKAVTDVIPTSVQTFSITWDESKYSAIDIHLTGIRTDTDNSTLSFRVGHTNGSVMATSSGNYDYMYNDFINASIPWTADGLDTEVEIANGDLGNQISPVIAIYSGRVQLNMINDSLLGCAFDVDSLYQESGDDQKLYFAKGMIGEYNGVTDFAGDIDTIEFRLQSGAKFISTGIIKIYGLLK